MENATVENAQRMLARATLVNQVQARVQNEQLDRRDAQRCAIKSQIISKISCHNTFTNFFFENIQCIYSRTYITARSQPCVTARSTMCAHTQCDIHSKPSTMIG